MMTREHARSMALRLIPNRGTAVVTLNVSSGTATSVTCPNAWLKQETGGLANYGGVNVEQDKTILKIFEHELNPASNGRQIRAEDEIIFDGVTYVVTSAGGGRKSVRTVWDCIVQKKIY